MPVLSKEAILKARRQPRRTEDVPVPEWADGDATAVVRVRELSGAERDAYEGSWVKFRKGKRELNLSNLRARLVAMCVVDESGQPMFKESDAEKLGELNAAALDRVYQVCQRLSGLSEEQIEDLAKNSEPIPAGDSVSV